MLFAGSSFAADNDTINGTNHIQGNNTINGLTENNTLPDPTNTRTGTQYSTIQAAINDALSGDNITLEQGHIMKLW